MSMTELNSKNSTLPDIRHLIMIEGYLFELSLCSLLINKCCITPESSQSFIRNCNKIKDLQLTLLHVLGTVVFDPSNLIIKKFQLSIMIHFNVLTI